MIAISDFYGDKLNSAPTHSPMTGWKAEISHWGGFEFPPQVLLFTSLDEARDYFRPQNYFVVDYLYWELPDGSQIGLEPINSGDKV